MQESEGRALKIRLTYSPLYVNSPLHSALDPNFVHSGHELVVTRTRKKKETGRRRPLLSGDMSDLQFVRGLGSLPDSACPVVS